MKIWWQGSFLLFRILDILVIFCKFSYYRFSTTIQMSKYRFLLLIKFHDPFLLNSYYKRQHKNVYISIFVEFCDNTFTRHSLIIPFRWCSFCMWMADSQNIASYIINNTDYYVKMRKPIDSYIFNKITQAFYRFEFITLTCKAMLLASYSKTVISWLYLSLLDMNK